MRIVFMATGDIAIPALDRLIHSGRSPIALVTQPDRPVGRHQNQSVPPAVKHVAQAAGIPVFQPALANEIAPTLASMQPDVIVVMAYGQILKKPILSLPRIAIINLHASLLPKYRGAACIQAAIDAGDLESGITAIHVVRQLDAGDIIHSRTIPISADDTGGTLHNKLATLAPEVLIETLSMLEHGSAKRVPQKSSLVSHVGKLLREDGRIDWSRDAQEIERRIRAYEPWPGSYTTYSHKDRVKRLKIFPKAEVHPHANSEPGHLILSDEKILVGCGTGALCLAHVQPEGGKRMAASEFFRGRHADMATSGGVLLE